MHPQAPVPAEAAAIVGPTAWGILIAVGLFLNFGLGVIRAYFDRKDRSKIAEAAGCHYPPDVTQALRDGLRRQVEYGTAQQAAIEETDRAINRLVLALDKHTEKLIEVLVRMGR